MSNSTRTTVSAVISATVSDSQSQSSQEQPDLRRQQQLRVTQDGTFNRQRVYFTKRFGYGVDDIPVLPNRYIIIGLVTCGWNRRLRIIRRLLGLENVIAVESVLGGDGEGWILNPEGFGKKFGYTHLGDFYEATDPFYEGKGTSPAIIDTQAGHVVTNNYHTLPLDLETVWAPFHKEGAPDLYPKDLRTRIDLLNQQLFDDVNNGTYKVLFAQNAEAARVAYDVFRIRLEDLDYRLASRRYLFGSRLTDSDVRLFQTLESYESTYRPGITRQLGSDDAVHIWDYPHLWDYARDLFQTPGFIDDEEKYEFGFIPDEHGNYSPRIVESVNNDSVFGGPTEAGRPEFLQRWLEPVDRTALTGDEWYSGPGTAGTEELWQFGHHVNPLN